MIPPGTNPGIDQGPVRKLFFIIINSDIGFERRETSEKNRNKLRNARKTRPKGSHVKRLLYVALAKEPALRSLGEVEWARINFA